MQNFEIHGNLKKRILSHQINFVSLKNIQIHNLNLILNHFGTDYVHI